jgi:lipid-binding SYLF domain-containing protein
LPPIRATRQKEVGMTWSLTRRGLASAAVAALMLPHAATAQADQQALVDRATLTVNELLGGEHGADARTVLRRARAVMIFPRVFRGGFILGGEGGSGVLLARDGAGNWSSPAFYGMGGGSLGLQIGVQDSQVMLFIMNDRALNAILQSQFKFGADASVAVAHIGAGIAGGTTDAPTWCRSRSRAGSMPACRSRARSWRAATRRTRRITAAPSALSRSC